MHDNLRRYEVGFTDSSEVSRAIRTSISTVCKPYHNVYNVFMHARLALYLELSSRIHDVCYTMSGTGLITLQESN